MLISCKISSGTDVTSDNDFRPFQQSQKLQQRGQGDERDGGWGWKGRKMIPKLERRVQR
jgi:hypothetical protein